MKILIKPTWIV